MSVLKVLGAALAATVLVSSQVNALTVTNRDTSPYTVYIQKGDNESEHALPSGQSLNEVCEEGCVVRLAGIEGDHSAQDADTFVIQDGALQREQQ
jgi:hypothetical protein